MRVSLFWDSLGLQVFAKRLPSAVQAGKRLLVSLLRASLVVVMASMWPNDTEAATMLTIDALVPFAGLDAGVFGAWSAHGGGVASIRVFAMLPGAAVASGASQVRVPTRSGTAAAPSETA